MWSIRCKAFAAITLNRGSMIGAVVFFMVLREKMYLFKTLEYD